MIYKLLVYNNTCFICFYPFEAIYISKILYPNETIQQIIKILDLSLALP